VIAAFRTLVQAGTLAQHLDDPDWVVVDTRFDLADPVAGRRAYAQGHIPGAFYAHLDEDLAGPVRADSGRHPLPAPEALARTFSTWGVDERTQLVAYDDSSGAYAARLWWLARWLGHDAVAVLDGGLAAWRALALPEVADAPRARQGVFTPRLRQERAISTAEVADALQRGTLLLIDARAAARFRGEVEPIDARAGHVPGARNRPFTENLGPDGRFRDASALRADYAALLDDRSPADVACMCGSGVTACHDLLALEHAGFRGARLYVGSWSEWIRNPARVVATGAAP
jgi:thiosulfate/3-mercaptopyruvate sulfurtransferase